MMPAASSASVVPAEPARTPKPTGSTVDPAVITLPETGNQVDARGLALAVLAVLATIYALSWAQAFMVPLLLGIVISYTLNPVVTRLEALRLPRVVATVIVMAGVMGALGMGAYSLRGQVQTIIEQLPEASAKFAAGLARMQVGQTGNLQKVQSAATVMEKAATQAAGGPAAPRQPATHVIVDAPTFKLSSFLWQGSIGALGAIGEAVMVAFLVFFLLLGETHSSASSCG